MQLLMLVTADYASVDTASGKLNILGAFSRIYSRQFPVQHNRLSLALKVWADLGDHHDERKLVIELIDEDSNRHFHISGPVQFPRTGSGLPGEFNAVVELNGIMFPHPGYYWFTVSIDGEEVGKTPVELALVQNDQRPE